MVLMLVEMQLFIMILEVLPLLVGVTADPGFASLLFIKINDTYYLRRCCLQYCGAACFRAAPAERRLF